MGNEVKIRHICLEILRLASVHNLANGGAFFTLTGWDRWRHGTFDEYSEQVILPSLRKGTLSPYERIFDEPIELPSLDCATHFADFRYEGKRCVVIGAYDACRDRNELKVYVMEEG